MNTPSTGFPVLGAGIAALGLVGLIAACGEAAVAYQGLSARAAVYVGGAGAMFASLCGLPFLVKMTSLGEDPTGAFWKLWGLGLVTRTGVGLLAAVGLIYGHRPPVEAGILTLALVYFAALMFETVWVAKRLNVKK